MADSISNPPPAPASTCCPAINLTFAFWLLRLFMGMRLILSGLEKLGYFVAKGNEKFMSALKGTAWFGEGGITALRATEQVDGVDRVINQGLGTGKMWPIAKLMLDNTKLPVEMIKPFMVGLPYAMVVAGVLILAGLFNRVGWFLAGLIWFSLAFGQMLLPDEVGVQWLGLYVFICALALCLIDHNRVRLTKF